MTRRNKPNKAEQEALEQELSELADAFNDGFTVPVNGASIRIDISDFGYDTFFPTHVRSTLADAKLETKTLGAVISDNDDSVDHEDQEPTLEDHLLETYERVDPKWRSSNPFNFSLERVRAWALKRYREVSGRHPDITKELLDPDNWGSGPPTNWTYDVPKVDGDLPVADAFAAQLNPFSQDWFITQIVAEFGAYDASRKRLKEPENNFYSHQGAMESSCASAAKIGRLVEQYRWRFLHGPHMARGKAQLEGASEGGVARAREFKPVIEKIVKAMEVLVGQGMTVSKAAHQVKAGGLGESPEANRRAYNRAQQKKKKKT